MLMVGVDEGHSHGDLIKLSFEVTSLSHLQHFLLCPARLVRWLFIFFSQFDITRVRDTSLFQ